MTTQVMESAAGALPAYAAWLKGLAGKPVFVAYPAGFDFLFVYWYLIRFAGESPFSFSALKSRCCPSGWKVALPLCLPRSSRGISLAQVMQRRSVPCSSAVSPLPRGGRTIAGRGSATAASCSTTASATLDRAQKSRAP